MRAYLPCKSCYVNRFAAKSISFLPFGLLPVLEFATLQSANWAAFASPLTPRPCCKGDLDRRTTSPATFAPAGTTTTVTAPAACAHRRRFSQLLKQLTKPKRARVGAEVARRCAAADSTCDKGESARRGQVAVGTWGEAAWERTERSAPRFTPPRFGWRHRHS